MSSSPAKVAITASVVLGAAAAAYYAYKTSQPVKEAVDTALHRAEESWNEGKEVASVALTTAAARARAFKEAAASRFTSNDSKKTSERLEPLKCSLDAAAVPELSQAIQDRLKRAISSLLEDYITTGDISEACQCMRDILAVVAKECGDGVPANRQVDIVAVELVKKALYLCLDRPQRDQEIMACLLSSLEVFGCFTSEEIARGFDVLLARFEDVLLDAPEAAMVLAIILAHLVLDGTLTESYIVNHAVGSFKSPKVDQPLELAGEDAVGVPQMLGFASWMLYGKIPMPLQQMKTMIRAFVQSCLLTGEPVALEAMVVELHAPHYNYEIIKKLVQVSLDGTAYDRERASSLIAALGKQGFVKQDQLVEAFLRLYRSLPELAIDVPQAPDAVARFTAHALHANVLPADFHDTMMKLVLSTAASAAIGNASLQLTHLTSAGGDVAWQDASAPIGIWGVPKVSYANEEFAKITQLFVTLPADDGADDGAAEAAIEAAVTTAETNGLAAYLPGLVSQVGVLAAKCSAAQGQFASQLLRTLVDAGTLDASYLLIGLFRIMEIIEFAQPERVSYRDAHFAVVDDQDHLVQIGTWLHLMLVACVDVGLLSSDLFAMLPEHLSSRLDVDDDTDEDADITETPAQRHGSKSMLATLQRFFNDSMNELANPPGTVDEDGGDNEAEADDDTA